MKALTALKKIFCFEPVKNPKKLIRFLINKTFFIFNLGAAVLLALSNLSSYIDPSRFWFFSVLGLMFPYLVLINILLLIYWIFQRKFALIYSLLALVLSFHNIQNTFSFQLSGESYKNNIEHSTSTIRLMTYNVRLFNRFEKKNFEIERQTILDFIEKENPDIICMQEFYSEKGEISGFLSQFSSKKNNHIYYTAQHKNQSYGIATFSKYPIVKKKVLNYKNTDNISIYSDIVINNDTIRVFNNHLQSIKFLKNNYNYIDSIWMFKSQMHITEIKDISSKLKKAFILRSKQVEKVKELIDQSPYPVIVCGDFNDTPVSYTYKIMSQNLKDVFKEKGFGLGHTYNGSFPSYRIDYIMHSNEFNIIDYRREKIIRSDHYPVIVYLNF